MISRLGSIWFPLCVVLAAVGLLALEFWSLRQSRRARTDSPGSNPDRGMTILTACLLLLFGLARLFLPPSLDGEQTYTAIVQARETREIQNISTQLSNFAAQAGAITNEWSLPGVTALRRKAPPITAEAVTSAFAHETNVIVISLVPREVKFSTAEDLPRDFNHVLHGLHVGHAVSDASLEVQVAVNDHFWQMLQSGQGKATELLVALRGIHLEQQQPAWAKKPVILIKGHTRSLQWFEPPPEP